MSKITYIFIASVMLVAVLVGAGALLFLTTPAQPQTDYAATALAQAVALQLTQIAQSNPTAVPTQPTQPPVIPTATPEPTATAVTPPTAQPTNPPVVVFTPTATPLPCNWAQFIADVSVKDGSLFSPGVTFTKTWRLKNIGSCTWTKDYALVFVSGEAMGGPAAVNLKGDVRPGESVDLSVVLKSPAKVGDYRGTWMLRNGAGARFGLGADASKGFWVKITVRDPNLVVYDFVKEACKAAWRNAEVSLACPGIDTDTAGYVVRIDRPRLENGILENEPALITQPQMVPDGVIHGRYPDFNVKAGDHFKAVIGCMSESTGCRVTFRLRYRIGGGDVQTLAYWEEKLDGKITKVDVDLTPLAGKSVQFILSIKAGGSADGDQAFWMAPRIVR